MQNTSIKRGIPALAIVASVLLAAFGLTACGGSSSSSATTSSSTTSASARAGAPNAGRFTALRECLKKNGITLPQRTPGARRPQGGRVGGLLGGGGGAGGAQLPKGVTRAQLQAAMRKCGGNGAFAGGRANNPAFKQSLAKFASCMRENGVKLPAPNTAGGPVFNTKGLNTHSKAFVAAEGKCESLLQGSFRRGGAGGGAAPGAAGGTPGGGAPGAGQAGGAAPPASGETQSQ
jgi:hypothetical protein